MTTETAFTPTTVAHIPLDRLAPWQGNVRRTGRSEGIDSLAASIAAHGLLQSLVVRQDKGDGYEVVAGRRRILALRKLAKAGTLAPDHPVPCNVIADAANGTEVSLAENAMREPMHPADEFDAFKALQEQGMEAADIAARFGVSEAVVRKRLTLAHVSPALLRLYREGAMTLQHVMAFAVTDDHEAQERVWNDLADWQKDDPGAIRDALTESETTAADRRVKFVGLKAYEKAGGSLRRDLFASGDDGVFILDAALLDRLVAEKLEKAKRALLKQGWKWVEIRDRFDRGEWSRCKRVYPEQAPLTDEEEQELAALEAEADAFHDIEGELTDEQQARFDAITERIEEIEDRDSAWTPEALATAGAVVSIGYRGDLDIEEGLVCPEDQPRTPQGGDHDGEPAATRSREGDGLPAALVETLTAHRSAALAASLAASPNIALAALVHGLALQTIYDGRGSDICIEVRASAQSLRLAHDSRAALLLDEAGEAWRERLPQDPAQLLGWCLAQDPGATLLDLLAYCVSRTVDAVRRKGDRADDPRTRAADDLAAALDLDMSAWFTPTAENYFSRIGKAAIVETLLEAKGGVAPAWERAKKAELAAIAEREIAGTGWLPSPLRRPALPHTADAA